MKTRNLLLLLFLMLASTTFAQNETSYFNRFKQLFEDDICTVLAEPYASMSDEELMATMQGYPQSFINIAMKVKNNTWEEYEKEFRVATFKPYSNSFDWSSYLINHAYSDLNTPTGICSTVGDTLLIFVDISVKYPASITVAEVISNDCLAKKETYLYQGLNVFVPTVENASLFINYDVKTTRDDKSTLLSDYAPANIHIEGGTLNGYFDKERHTNNDWIKMRQTIMKHELVNVKGEKALFHMHLDKVAAACPDNIYESIDWWDTIVKWQHQLMGATQYYDRWNSMMMCRDGDGGNMSATYLFTYFPWEYLKDILPYESIMKDPGQAWGPAHEIGHMNQGAINIVSCTEVSNNLFSNMVVQRIGKTTTRGMKIDKCIEDYNNNIAFPLRSEVFSKTRMYWQLYLYFHEAKHDTTFYPRLFEHMRNKPMSSTSSVNGKFNQLRFAEACCEIAQMDLSEFFEAWGFFVPMQAAYVGDYSDYYVTLSAEDAEQSRINMQKYSKKGGHLMFIEDRVKPSKRSDGVDGYRSDWNSEVPVGTAGDVGQWEDYMNHDVKAKGYIYTTSGKNITILTDENSGGAVGFKLYNEDGKFVSFSNRYKMSVPTEVIGKKFKVVAAQADGTDVEIPSAAEAGNEEQQLEALNAALTAANNILNYIAKQATQVGYYKEEAVATLKEYVAAANEAIEKKDQSTLTYGQMATQILNEVYRLSADNNSKIAIVPLNYYTMSSRPGNLAYYNNSVTAASNAQVKPASDDRKWEFIQANEEGTFYMKNVGQGTFIANLKDNAQVTLSDNIAEASPITIVYNGDGTVSFTQTGNNSIALNAKSDKSIRGYSATDSNSSWKVTLAADNNTAIENVEAEDAASENVIYDLAGRKLKEITAPGIYIINGKKRLVK